MKFIFAKLTSLMNIITERLNKGRLAFTMALHPPELNKKGIDLLIPRKSFGFLFPEEKVDLIQSNLELKVGRNFFVNNNHKFEITSDPNKSYNALAIFDLESTGEVKFINKESIKTIYHGEKVDIDGKKYSLHLIHPRSFLFVTKTVQCLLVSFLFSILGIFSLNEKLFAGSGDNSSSSPDITPLHGLVEYKTSESFNIKIPLLLNNKISADSIKAQAFKDGINYPFDVIKVRQQPFSVTFLVDASSFCTTRGMNPYINQSIKDVVSMVPLGTPITLGHFYTDKQLGQELYTTVFANRPSDQIPIHSLEINCTKHQRSINAFKAIRFINNKEIKENELIIIFSSGNISDDAESFKILKETKARPILIFYNPFMNNYSKEAITEVQKSNDLKLINWNNAEQASKGILHRIQSQWIVTLKDKFPIQVDFFNGPINLEITPQNSKNPKLFHMNGHYERDKLIYNFYRLKIGAAAVAAFLFLLYLLIKLVKYFRPNYSRYNNKIISRTWNQDLFPLLGRTPMFVIKENNLYLKTHAFTQDSVTLGNIFLQTIKLPNLKKKILLKIDKKTSSIFQIGLEHGPEYILNKVKYDKPQFIKHGDRLYIENYTIDFLWPSVE